MTFDGFSGCLETKPNALPEAIHTLSRPLPQEKESKQWIKSAKNEQKLHKSNQTGTKNHKALSLVLLPQKHFKLLQKSLLGLQPIIFM